MQFRCPETVWLCLAIRLARGTWGRLLPAPDLLLSWRHPQCEEDSDRRSHRIAINAGAQGVRRQNGCRLPRLGVLAGMAASDTVRPLAHSWAHVRSILINATRTLAGGWPANHFPDTPRGTHETPARPPPVRVRRRSNGSAPGKRSPAWIPRRGTF